jgi:solute carrier family 10 (sodium/bile acid cotransporter), member 7
VWRSISQQWFLCSLAISLALGFIFPEFFSSFAHSAPFRTGIVVTVMSLMGWTLQPRSVARSIRQPLPSMLAIAINVAVVPLLAWPTLWLLPQELSGGLIVAALIPCTLASASVWTRAAGGDEAVAMMTTVVTNLACFVVAPVGLWMLLGQQVQVDVGDQMRSLLWQVVLPLVAGQGLRQLGLATMADRNRKTISNFAQIGILVMVLFGSVISAERMADNPSKYGWELLTTAVLASVIHTVAVAIGYFAAAALGIKRPQQLAVAISGGQKTLMVGLQLALITGVSVMPMVMYHVGQLLIDTLLVRWWKKQDGVDADDGDDDNADADKSLIQPGLK